MTTRQGERSESVGELLDQLGGVPPGRVRLRPWPGTATEGDLIRLNDRKERLRDSAARRSALTRARHCRTASMT